MLIQITSTPEIVKLRFSNFFLPAQETNVAKKQIRLRTCTTAVWQGMFTELITDLSTDTDVYDTYGSNLATGYLPT